MSPEHRGFQQAEGGEQPSRWSLWGYLLLWHRGHCPARARWHRAGTESCCEGRGTQGSKLHLPASARVHQVSFKQQLSHPCAFWREVSEWEVFREGQHTFCKSWNFTLFTAMPHYRLQTTKCNDFPVTLGNSVFLTVCSMFTRADSMLSPPSCSSLGSESPQCPVLWEASNATAPAGTWHSCGIQGQQHISTSGLVLLLADGIYNILISKSHFDFILST